MAAKDTGPEPWEGTQAWRGARRPPEARYRDGDVGLPVLGYRRLRWGPEYSDGSRGSGVRVQRPAQEAPGAVPAASGRAGLLCPGVTGCSSESTQRTPRQGRALRRTGLTSVQDEYLKGTNVEAAGPADDDHMASWGEAMFACIFSPFQQTPHVGGKRRAGKKPCKATGHVGRGRHPLWVIGPGPLLCRKRS